MTLDITYGNMTQEEADRLGTASICPVDAQTACDACAKHQPGDTEPWVSRLVGDLIVALGARTVLETGSFTGATSVYICDALSRLGGGEYSFVEIEPERAWKTVERVGDLCGEQVRLGFNIEDVLTFLARNKERRWDVAFIDDDHAKPHVRKELAALYPFINPGGLILLHDVYGSCDLKEVVREFGGYPLDLPRLGPAGGLGIIQC